MKAGSFWRTILLVGLPLTAHLPPLTAQPGRAFTRLQLLEAVQGTAYEGYERTIDAHIKNLRAKIEPNTKNPRLIETVFGVGYRLVKERMKDEL